MTTPHKAFTIRPLDRAAKSMMTCRFSNNAYDRYLTLWLALAPAVFVGIRQADAYTQVCGGPATVTTVSTVIQVPPGAEFKNFVTLLEGFAREHRYIEEGNKADSEHLNLTLLKMNTAEAIHLSNDAHAGEINASMSECGSEGFRPYWREFMRFVKKYVAGRPNYPQ